MGLERERSYFLIFSALYAVNMIFSYPVQFYPIIDTINKINVHYNISDKYRYILRFITTAIIFSIAFAVPKFGVMLNLVGAFSGVALQFFFPIFAYNIHFKNTINKKTKYLNYLIIIISFICGVFSI